jgi:hypothetical protein
MDTFLAVLVLFTATALLCLLPLVPALVELYRKSDRKPLAINRDHDGQVRRFAFGFREYLDQQVNALVFDRDEPGFAEGRFPDGTRFCLLREGYDAPRGPLERHSPASPQVVLAGEPMALPARTTFSLELYAAGELDGGAESCYRAILGEKAIHLGRGSTVFRWIHSEDTVWVGPECTLHGRASAERLIHLSAGCQFERLHAARLEFGASPFSSGDLEEGMPLSPAALRSAADVSGDRHLFRGDLTLPAGTVFQGDLVVTGRLHVGEDACIRGRVKSHGEITVSAGARIEGSLVSGRSIHLGTGCRIAGPVIAEREIVAAAGCQLGAADCPTTVCAPYLRIEAGVVAFGTVWARRRGQVG